MDNEKVGSSKTLTTIHDPLAIIMKPLTTCSLTQLVMAEPVSTSAGSTYEKEAIEQWLNTHDTDPKTGTILARKDLIHSQQTVSTRDAWFGQFPSHWHDEDLVYLPKQWQRAMIEEGLKIGNREVMSRYLLRHPGLLTMHYSEYADETLIQLFCRYGQLADFAWLQERWENDHQGCTQELLSKSYEKVSLYEWGACNKLPVEKLNRLFEVDQRKGKGETLLHYAVEHQSKILAAWWLDNEGGDKDSQNEGEQTALMLAVANNDDALVELLLKHGCETEKTTKTGETALYQAIDKKFFNIAKQLLAHDANPAIYCSENDKWLLEVAMLNGAEKEMIHQMLAQGAEPKARNSKQQTIAEALAAKGKGELANEAREYAQKQKGNLQRQLWELSQQLQTQTQQMQSMRQETQARFEKQQAIIAEQAKTIDKQREENRQLIQRLSQTMLGRLDGLQEVMFENARIQQATVTSIIEEKTRPALDLSKYQPLTIKQLSAELSNSPKAVALLWWRNTKPRVINERTLQGHSRDVSSVVYDPTGTYLASGSEDNTIKIWNTRTWQCEQTLQGHSRDVSSVVYDHTGAYLVSGSRDNTIKIWNTRTWQCEQTLQGSGNVRSVTYNPTGAYLVSSSSDNTIKIWNTKTWQCEQTLQGSGDVRSVTYDPTGACLASSSLDNTIKIWNTRTWQCEQTLQGYGNVSGEVTYDPTGAYLASVNIYTLRHNSAIRIWNTRTWQCEQMLQRSGNVSSVTYDPTGAYLASVGDSIIKIWNTRTWQCEQTLRGWGGVGCVTYDPIGAYLVASNSNNIRIYEFALKLKQEDIFFREDLREQLELKRISNLEIYLKLSDKVRAEQEPNENRSLLKRVINFIGIACQACEDTAGFCRSYSCSIEDGGIVLQATRAETLLSIEELLRGLLTKPRLELSLREGGIPWKREAKTDKEKGNRSLSFFKAEKGESESESKKEQNIKGKEKEKQKEENTQPDACLEKTQKVL